MKAKYLVRRVVENEGGRSYAVLGTALLFNDGERGVILTREWGGLDLHEDTRRPTDGAKRYLVKKAKATRSGRVISREVGSFVVRDDGVTATLYLNLIDAPLAAYRSERSTRSVRLDQRVAPSA